MKRQKQNNFWDMFLKHLANRLQEPDENLHSVRVVSEVTLKRLCRDVAGEIDTPKSSRPAGPAMVRHLVESGLARQLPVEVSGKPTGKTRIYALGFGAQRMAPAPVEILQAAEPGGVACYFAAIDFYELTTQLPTYHHVAVPTEYNTPLALEPVIGASADRTEGGERLGTLMFRYDGVPYYRTHRDARLLPGVQRRRFGYSIIRITTLEQTLLDTLHHPASCGGAAVIFEAWETAWERINQDRLADYLGSIKHGPLRRRVGCICDRLGLDRTRRLKEFLDKLKGEVSGDTPVVTLLKGIDGQELNSDWQVLEI